MNIEPLQSRISIIEGDLGVRNTTSDGVVQVIGCIELSRGNLQRNVTVSVVTVSSPTSTGTKLSHGIIFRPIPSSSVIKCWE